MTVPPLDIDRGRLVSRYGTRKLGDREDLHTGIDLAALEGTPVYAIAAGTVVVSAADGAISGYGNVVVIRHDARASRSMWTLYAHLNTRAVAVGDLVIEGQTIGYVGQTGRADGPHLHFEVLTKWPPTGKDLDRIDPTRFWPPAMSSGKTLVAVKKVVVQPSAAGDTRARTADGTLVAVAALGWWLWKKEKRRRSA